MFRKENMTDEEYFKRGQYTKQNGKMTTLTTDVALNYSKTWNEKHVLFANTQWSLGRQNRVSDFSSRGFANEQSWIISLMQKYA